MPERPNVAQATEERSGGWQPPAGHQTSEQQDELLKAEQLPELSQYGPPHVRLMHGPKQQKFPAPIMPTRLQIPAVKLNAAVETVGVLENGQMGVPKAFDKVGILAPWTKPGEKGNAVMAGHFDHYTGPAVFYPLRRLKPGDQVVVSGGGGRKLIFIVQSVESYPTNKAPIEKIFGTTDQRRLNLITCDGKFNRKTQEHARRLVVFTRLAEEQPLAEK